MHALVDRMSTRFPLFQKLDGAPCFAEERQIGKEFLLGEAMIARFGNLESVFKKVCTSKCVVYVRGV